MLLDPTGVSSGGSCSYHSHQEHDGNHQAEQDQRNDQRQIVPFRFHTISFHRKDAKNEVFKLKSFALFASWRFKFLSPNVSV